MRSRATLQVLLLALALTGCRERAAASDVAQAEGSGAEPAQDEAPASAATPDGDTARADDATSQGAAPDRYAPPAADPTPEPADLITLMRAVGYADAVPADLEEFVHVPPGAQGEAGSFGSASDEVRVALVRYPNERYARPHRTDVEERRRVVPGLGEGVAQQGRFVVHVRAAERDRADAVVDALVAELGWDPVSDRR